MNEKTRILLKATKAAYLEAVEVSGKTPAAHLRAARSDFKRGARARCSMEMIQAAYAIWGKGE